MSPGLRSLLLDDGSGALRSPLQLGSVAAWFDETDANSLIYDSANRVSLISDKSGNSGTGSGTSTGLYQTGVAGQYASTPDSAAVSITGPIDIRAYVAATDYTPTGLLYMLVSKNTTAAGQYSYDFYISSTGNLVFRYSPDGTVLRTATSSVITGLTDRAPAWLRATYDSATGSVLFYTGGSDATPVWVQLGTTQVLTAGAIFAGTNAVAVGANSGGSGSVNHFNGIIYRAQIYNGIAGTLAFDANFVGQRTNATTFTESSSNAATVTINGTALLGWVDAANVLCLNGVAGNYASAPDSAALSITGDIDIRVHVALDDWTPAGDTSLVAKRTGAGQFSYQLDVKGTTGLLYFYVTNDGTTSVANISSVAPTVSDFGSLWVRVTRVSASGLTTFYTGTDGVSWTQLGTTVNAGLTTIFDSTAVLEIGSTLVGTANCVTGKIYRAQIYNGIAGTLAFDANFATCPKLAGSFIESSTNAAVVTINTSGATGARISGARDLYQGTAANQPILTTAAEGNYLTFDGSNDYLKAAAFSLSQPETVYFVGSQVTWTIGDYIYGSNATATDVRLRLFQFNTTPRLSNDTSGLGTNSGLALATNGIVSAIFDGASSSTRVNRAAAIASSSTTGAAGGFTLGSAADGTAPANITASEVLVFSGAHDTITQDRIILYLARKWKIAV